jgi:uncharacterized membrane protein YkvA (DUF1232 family)
MLTAFRHRVAELRAWTYALALAYRDPRVPWYARAVAICVVAYAFSPIDLIPDFVPVLGYLDDLVLVPLGIALAIRLIPRPVLEECRARAREMAETGQPFSRAGAAIVILIWLALAALGVVLAARLLRR